MFRRVVMSTFYECFTSHNNAAHKDRAAEPQAQSKHAIEPLAVAEPQHKHKKHAHRGILGPLRPMLVALTRELKAHLPREVFVAPSVAAVIAEAPASMRKSLQDLAERARATIGSALSTCGRVMTLPQVHAACPHSTCL